ncbi:MAG TPA: sigma-70 family RNA polymerase sigma factor [Parafilimonas sp.]|nr:sigma-70 family RNA polymerase sigma factor [Parafilimonas sp.]
MINAIKNGNPAAFEKVYKEHREKVYAYFLKKTNSSEDARDLLQTVFLKLWQYKSSLSAEYLLEQQIFHIARTVLIDHLRRQNKLQRIKESISKVRCARPAVTSIADHDVHGYLQKLLSGLPPLRKRVFELHRLEGYSYKEISEILSISVKSVDNNLAKALKHLRTVSLLLAFIVTVVMK